MCCLRGLYILMGVYVFVLWAPDGLLEAEVLRLIEGQLVILEQSGVFDGF